MRDTLLPQASDIDYTNVDEICGYQTLLCKIMEREGGLNMHPVSNAMTREVKKQGQVWLREVKFILNDILAISDSGQTTQDLSVVPELIHAYDFFYRVSNGAPCSDYIRELKVKTLKSWLSGNKTISVDELTLLLLSDIDHDILLLEKRYVDFAIRIEADWIAELLKHGTFIDATPSETYRRLTRLIRSDLSAYISSKDEKKVKTQWVKTHLLTDEDLALLSAKELQAYMGLPTTAILNGCHPTKTYRDLDDEYCRLISMLASRPDINPYFYQALEIDLALYAEA